MVGPVLAFSGEDTVEYYHQLMNFVEGPTLCLLVGFFFSNEHLEITYSFLLECLLFSSKSYLQLLYVGCFERAAQDIFSCVWYHDFFLTLEMFLCDGRTFKKKKRKSYFELCNICLFVFHRITREAFAIHLVPLYPLWHT